MSRKWVNPMLTATQVRLEFGDPEPRKTEDGQRFANAITKLANSIRQVRLGSKNKGGFPFNNLPYDIKYIIFEMVRSSPGWAHFKFERGQIVEFDGGNQEIYVNREWYQSPVLRQGLSQSNYVNKMNKTVGLLASSTLGLVVTDRKSLKTLKRAEVLGDRPFCFEVKYKVKSPPVRKRLDWFFFDGNAYMDTLNPLWPMPRSMFEIRTCVFKIDEVFKRIKRVLDSEEGKGFILDKRSKIENLVILLGEFRKQVSPSKMRQIRAYQVEDIYGEFSLSMNFYPSGADYSMSENYMMGVITQAWSKTICARRRKQRAWLESSAGRDWISHPVHDTNNIISKWLGTKEGHKWLKLKDYEFLASESGWWWLASDFGYPWLESQDGLQWLNTKAGVCFLDSPQALAWANTGTYSTSRGPRVQKTWFGTAAGRTWEHNNCPYGVPPDPPQRPTGQPHIDLIVPRCFNNINFKGWSFVKCPSGDTV
ncbi:hypothetical protein F4781DRAFT_444020 [Annulohypoxylon bovei var. microspora]|nr:hypothetical protein F4781DRAFT_444020 [Annulohypoxylon bovei var. microspora]